MDYIPVCRVSLRDDSAGMWRTMVIVSCSRLWTSGVGGWVIHSLGSDASAHSQCTDAPVPSTTEWIPECGRIPERDCAGTNPSIAGEWEDTDWCSPTAVPRTAPNAGPLSDGERRSSGARLGAFPNAPRRACRGGDAATAVHPTARPHRGTIALERGRGVSPHDDVGRVGLGYHRQSELGMHTRAVRAVHVGNVGPRLAEEYVQRRERLLERLVRRRL